MQLQKLGEWTHFSSNSNKLRSKKDNVKGHQSCKEDDQFIREINILITRALVELKSLLYVMVRK